MSAPPQLTCAAEPSNWAYRWYALRRIPGRAREKVGYWLLLAACAVMEEGNLVAHARRELKDSLALGPNDPDRWVADGMIRLMKVFSNEGHSGGSAGFSVAMFEKLARFQPWGPLLGTDDEWFHHGDGMFQNKRCGNVFKQPDRFNGQAYDIDGRIFREPSGCCYTNAKSFTPITFPYTPKREYVDVPASAA